MNPIRLLSVLIVLLASAQLLRADDPISGRFMLTDHTGKSVTQRSYDGRLRLVFFGFTQCPDVCPTTLFQIRLALDELGDNAVDVVPLFISVDLANDTQDVLAGYVGSFHPAIIGLTGSTEQIDAAAGAFNVTAGAHAAHASDSAKAEVFHSPYLFLMDRQGALLDVFGYGARAESIAAGITMHLPDG